MLRFLLPLLLCLVAATADARCRSTDYRTHLTPDQRARFERAVGHIPYAHGNHWIASRGDRILHVIGTKHTGDARMNRVIRRLRPVITGADALLMEVSGHEAEGAYDDFDVFKTYMMLPEGQSLRTMLSDAVWADLTARLGRRGMDPRALDRLQPWFVSEMVDQISCATGGPRLGGRGLDDRIEAIARRSRVPIGSLETVGQSFGAMRDMPRRDHVRFIELELDRQRRGNLTRNELDDAYFEEAIGDILVMSRWSLYTDYRAPRAELDRLYDNLTGALLTQRNRSWLPVILRTPGDTIVVAVGAAHLPGRGGLLSLLKSRGYTLTRAPF